MSARGGITSPGSIRRCRSAFAIPSRCMRTASSSSNPQPPTSAITAGMPAAAAALVVVPLIGASDGAERTTYGKPNAIASPRASASTADSS